MLQAGAFLSRRKLLAGLGAVATAAAAIVISPLRRAVTTTARDLIRDQPTLRRMLLSLADAGYDEWTDQVGSIFLVGGGTRMKLVAVTPFAADPGRPLRFSRDRAFLLMFDVQNGTVAGDLIYTALHPQYGGFPIFLSANRTLPYRMTAVFN